MKKFTKGYFKTAWADLTQDKRWWQPMLILSLVEIIPVIGSFITSGYLYDWAKEASWGLNRAFPRQAGDVVKRLKYGFFAFVVTLVWMLPFLIVAPLVNAIPFVGTLLYLVVEVVQIIAAVVAVAAALRALTYERIEPGLQIGRNLKMAQQDTGGLARCFLISLVGSLIVGVIAAIFLVPIIMNAGLSAGAGSMGMYEYGYGYGYDYSVIRQMLPALLASLPLLFVLFLVLNFISTVVSALSLRAYGYWLGQFEPARWGRSEDPMPFERQTITNPYGVPYAGPQPGAAQPGASVDPQQQARDAALYEEAKRATDAGSRAAEWDQEFAASQQAAGAAAAGAAGAAGAALLTDGAAQDEQGAQAEAPQSTEEDAPHAEEPSVDETSGMAEAAEAAEGPEVEPEPEAEAEAAPESAVETVGAVVAEESVGVVEAEEAVGAVAQDEPAPTGWRSATNAAAAEAPAVVEALVPEADTSAVEEQTAEEAQPTAEQATEAQPEEPEEKLTGWRSASNAAN